MLGHTLDLYCCKKITDVLMLRNFHTLKLSCCQNIPKYQINN